MITKEQGTHPVKLIGLNGNLKLAERIAEQLDVPLIETSTKHFADGEIQINIDETIRGADVFVIQSIQEPVNENLMEVLIMIDALRRASAHEINIVLPYFAYSRSDRKTRAREPITAKLVANMIEEAGADRVITLDLHADQIQGFFDIPVDHLEAVPILAKYFKQLKLGTGDDIVIVSPDHSGTKLARKMAEYFDAPIAIVDQRGSRYDATPRDVIGDVAGKKAIVIDDMIDTGMRLVYSTNSLLQAGASEVYGAATHGIFSEGSKEHLNSVPIKKIVTTDSIQYDEDHYPDNLVQLCVDEIFAQAIYNIANNISIHQIFKDQRKI